MNLNHTSQAARPSPLLGPWTNELMEALKPDGPVCWFRVYNRVSVVQFMFRVCQCATGFWVFGVESGFEFSRLVWFRGRGPEAAATAVTGGYRQAERG